MLFTHGFAGSLSWQHGAALELAPLLESPSSAAVASPGYHDERGKQKNQTPAAQAWATLTSMYCVQDQYSILKRKKGEHTCFLNNNYLLLDIITCSIIIQYVAREITQLWKQRVPSLTPSTYTKGQAC